MPHWETVQLNNPHKVKIRSLAPRRATDESSSFTRVDSRERAMK